MHLFIPSMNICSVLRSEVKTDFQTGFQLRCLVGDSIHSSTNGNGGKVVEPSERFLNQQINV